MQKTLDGVDLTTSAEPGFSIKLDRSSVDMGNVLGAGLPLSINRYKLGGRDVEEWTCETEHPAVRAILLTKCPITSMILDGKESYLFSAFYMKVGKDWKDERTLRIAREDVTEGFFNHYSELKRVSGWCPFGCRVYDGWQVRGWPEFLALAKKLDIDPAQRKIRIRVFEGEFVGGEGKDGYQVFRWPEYQALCKRLGIPNDLLVIGTEIVLSEGEMPKAFHTFGLIDEKNETPKPQLADGVKPTAVINTTTIKNEFYRTSEPRCYEKEPIK